jgi:phage tail sheath protein FI
MPDYMTPGVYVEEVPSQSKPIEGVGTAIAAFVGLAPGGPLNTPIRCANWSQFVRTFGDVENPKHGPFMEGAYLAHAVFGYFNNGGGLCWVVRVGDEGGAAPTAALPAAGQTGSGAVERYRATARESIAGPVELEVSEEPGSAAKGGPTYRIVVSAGGEREEFTGLTVKKGRANIATKLKASSKLITIEEVGDDVAEAERAPALGTYTLTAPVAAATPVTASSFEGDVASRAGMGGLAAVDEITMVCMPDAMTLLNGDDIAVRDLQTKMIAHCELAMDRMAILDTPPGLSPQSVHHWVTETAKYDSKFAALYYPWLQVMDPLSKRPITVPPSGHMAGVWARTDATRGVHKAPANEVALGVVDLGFQVTHDEQGALNRAGINCIRAFTGRGIRVWGARTLSSDPEWRYLNVRRLFNFISESIREGTQWAVFEPNDERLWIALRVSVTNFLTRVWRDGALFGASPEQAFFVRCDAETNPPDLVEAGHVTVVIGIAPVKPAEFVVFQISQFQPGSAT